jgi:CheY-like chemotaxis protein
MAKPTLLTVDDDPNVLKAIETDLRARYGEKYRVLRANSGDAGLEILRELRVRNDAVALLLADQRMPQMDGIGFLNEAREVYSDAKRALLTACADTLPAVYRFENSKAEPALYPFRCRVTDFAARTCSNSHRPWVGTLSSEAGLVAATWPEFVTRRSAPASNRSRRAVTSAEPEKGVPLGRLRFSAL